MFELLRLNGLLISGARLQELGRPAQDRALHYARSKDREEFIAGRVALRHLAASLLDVDPARLVPDYVCPQCGHGQDHGRPGFMLDGAPAPLALSASKAQGWLLLAGVVHPTPALRLGVDLEATNQAAFEGFDDVALTPGEKHFLKTMPENQWTVQRARLWARKEAWLKMTGEGLRRDPADLDVLDLPGLCDIPRIHENGQELPEGFVAAVAVS
ncbi:hypothetical protein StoSoilB5_16070 [Arthrobacter sp. StoSoilB5]|nr:hypothetical protein StoSoilB5_16070 [Arthrobacter sp. StoSoilB5]